ncbi:MAG: hypothetical protein FJW90_00730 [Actinobacteria bacterium]|nr:hypothetical protein [Actinomycetota bacterium]
MTDPEVEELRARVGELERRVDPLLTNTGAIDIEELGRDAPEVSAEVQSLIAKGEARKAAKLYMKETGADMATTVGALGELEQDARGG